MKIPGWRHALWIITGLMILPCLLFADETAPVGSITFFIGDVRVRPPGQETWDKGTLNHIVANGYSIRAGVESRAELTLNDKSVIRIGENTIFEVEELSMKDGKMSGKTNIPFGRMWSNMKKLGDKGVEVRSPNAVMAIRGTTFRADAGQDSSLSVYVYNGQVDVNQASNLDKKQEEEPTPTPQQPPPDGRPVPVRAPDVHPIPGPYQVTLEEWLQIVDGMKLVLRPDGSYSHEKFDQEQDRQDSWVDWNMQRDSISK